MKKLILILLLVLLVSCSKPAEKQPEVIDGLKQPESTIEKIVIPNVSTRQHGFEINMTGPTKVKIHESNNILLNITVKDILSRQNINNPSNWDGYIYYLANNITRLPRCFFSKQSEHIWNNNFCISTDEIPNVLYNRELFLIYTNNTFEKIQNKPIARIETMSNYIVINFTLSK